VKLYDLGKETFRLLRVCLVVDATDVMGLTCLRMARGAKSHPGERSFSLHSNSREVSKLGVMRATFAAWDISRRSRKLKELVGS
jgi:hypothetical protein